MILKYLPLVNCKGIGPKIELITQIKFVNFNIIGSHCITSVKFFMSYMKAFYILMITSTGDQREGISQGELKYGKLLFKCIESKS